VCAIERENDLQRDWRSQLRFKMVFHAIVMTVAGLIVTAGSAQANTIVYNFVGTGAPVNNPSATFPAEPAAFRLIVPEFINPPFPWGSHRIR
jgi:hypothetical protein